MNRKRRLKIEDFNPHLICVLCGGYFIDATTIIECLHSFCRACIVHYLETNRFCPICDVQVHKSKPLQNIRPDPTLQDLVYKLVPGLYQAELRSRREFYESHPECPPRDDQGDESFIYTPDECFSLTMEYYQESNHPLMKSQTPMKQEESITGDEDSRTAESRGASGTIKDAAQIPTTRNMHQLERSSLRNNTVELSEKKKELLPPDAELYLNKYVPSKNQADSNRDPSHKESLCDDGKEQVDKNKRHCLNAKDCLIKKRHMRCPAAVTITHLQKLIRAKYDLGCSHPVEILYRDEPLSDHLTLIDVAYIYKWRRKGPLNLCFRIFETTNEENYKQDVSNLQPSELDISQPGSKESNVKTQVSGKESKSKITDWKEVQLQISETGIMSVAGVSLERNNNLTSSNAKLLSNSAAVDSNSLPIVKSGTDKPDQTLTSTGKEIINSIKTPPEILSAIATDKNVEKIDSLASQSQLANAVGSTRSKQETPDNAIHNDNNKSVSSIKVKSECVNKKTGSVVSDNKVNNIGSEKRKSATPMKIFDSCGTVTKKAKMSPIKSYESLDLCLRPVVKAELTASLCSAVTNSNDLSGHKPTIKLMPPIAAARMEYDNRHAHPNREEEKKNVAGLSIVPVTPVTHNKKSPNSNSMGYKTLKVPPKTWNPSITRSSYLNSKGSPDGTSTNSNSTSGLSKTPEKVPKFFKMRNMPRYLGNPASGVKPMYQVAANSKTQETSEPSGKSKQVVMKIDPKTLCPIVAVVPPVTSSTPVTSPPEKPLYTTSPSTGTVDVPKTSPRIKTNSPSRKSQTSASSPGTNNPSPPVNFSHAARTGSPFPNAAHLNAALSARSPSAATSNNILLNPSNYSINPATLNLLSSNLSFLPNASNFLYGNYSSFAPPIRPNLNMVSPVSGLPSALTAFHAMPPSINMLFSHSHHRANSGSGFSSSTNRPQTPAVQRIPASKGNGNSTSSGYKATKSSNLPSLKSNQTQKPANSHTVTKTNSITTNPSNANDKNTHKKNSHHNDEVNLIKQTNPTPEINLSNNNTNLAKCKNPNSSSSSNVTTCTKEDVSPSILVAPSPVKLVEKCDTTKEASPAMDSIGQSEPQNPLPKLEVESLVALEKNALPSSEPVAEETVNKQTEIAKVPETNSEVLHCVREEPLVL